MEAHGLIAMERHVFYAPKWPAIAVAISALLALAAAVASLFWNAPMPVAIAGYVIGCIVSVASASTHRALENKERSKILFNS